VNVLQVNYTDLDGRRFNGYDLIADLRPRGFDCKQAVLTRRSKDPAVFSLWEGTVDEGIHGALDKIETKHSMSNLLFPWLRLLSERPEFAAADVVHYHLIHNQMMSLFDLPWLFRMKPSVITMHDAWFLTGRCIQPQGCERWRTGCGACPDLSTVFPMRSDHSDQMWRIKRDVFADLEADVVVASEYTRQLVRQSPITGHLPHVHLVPFGIRADSYLPDDARATSRRVLGIPEDDFVILFRSTASAYKGLRYLIDALSLRPPARPTTLLAVDQRRLLTSLAGEYNILELGWVEDESLYHMMYSAADVLVMPSTAEGFGLMALEAMAAGRPVVSFAGTAVPSVTRAPECGIAVPMGDSIALREELDQLAANRADALRRGQLGRRIARDEHRHERYLDALTDVYNLAAERRRIS
jgi:glycosyltransferase involved in cell wall biosynthesis